MEPTEGGGNQDQGAARRLTSSRIDAEGDAGALISHHSSGHGRHARLVAERDALAAVITSDPGWTYHRVQRDVKRLEFQLQALDEGDGWGELRGTPVGEAAIAWKKAQTERRRCLSRADHAGLRERHQLHKQAARAAEQEGPLREAFESLAGPERARIRAELPEAKRLQGELEGRYYGHLHFQWAHPEALRRLERLDGEIATAAWEMDVERQGLDGIAPLRPEPPQQARWLDRDVPALDRDLDLGLGL